MGRYQQVAPELAPDVYQQSAHDAFTRMAPEERAQFDSGGGPGLDRPFLEPAAKLSLDQRS
jgi:hypothetical protein